MSEPLLTILIPTRNRARHLDVLLSGLAPDLLALEERVRVLVSDNASVDATPAVTAKFLKACPQAVVLRHAQNLGAEGNFCECLSHVHSRYFWIIGDDDLPRAGVVAQVLALLERAPVDLLYLHSQWVRDITRADPHVAMRGLDFQAVNSSVFAHRVHVWTTFISGMVVNLQRLRELQPDFAANRYVGTSIVQLGWVLPLLMRGEHFWVSFQPCVLATSGNTGGYQPCKVFGTHFPDLVREICQPHSEVTREILGGLVWDYLPKLLWTSRFKRPGTFLEENMLSSMAPLKYSLGYALVLVPLAKLPRLLAAPFLLLSMLVAQSRMFRR